MAAAWGIVRFVAEGHREEGCEAIFAVGVGALGGVNVGGRKVVGTGNAITKISFREWSGQVLFVLCFVCAIGLAFRAFPWSRVVLHGASRCCCVEGVAVSDRINRWLVDVCPQVESQELVL